MSKVRHHGFRLVEPLVNRQIVLGHASEFAGAVLSVFNWVGHRRLNLPRIFGMANGFVPIVFHAYLRALNVKRDRSPAAFIVLVALGHKGGQEVAESIQIEASARFLFFDWFTFCSLELRGFGVALIAAAAVGHAHSTDAGATQYFREFQ